ncbi:c-type cytochrome biogenesis protein CcsB [Thermodesulfobacteriota bacterium]
MNSSLILSITTFVYGLAAFLYIFALIFKKTIPGRLATWTAILGVIGNTLGVIFRWVESYRLGIGHAPLSNMYESLVFFAWTIVMLCLIIGKRYKNQTIGAFSTFLAFLVMAYASLFPSSTIQPILPALKSNWLIAHVITCFIGYAAFAVAFGVSFMYLAKQGRDSDQINWFTFAKPVILFLLSALLSRIILHRTWAVSAVIALGACVVVYAAACVYKRFDPQKRDRFLALFPDLRILDELNRQLIMFGFLFLSVGIITGAVWANSAWGRYWGWDPKETWSLITWFIYATLLHARRMKGWHGKRIAFFSIIGFMAVLFTYFGVNYLPGLHSYGSVG